MFAAIYSPNSQGASIWNVMGSKVRREGRPELLSCHGEKSGLIESNGHFRNRFIGGTYHTQGQFFRPM